MTTYFRKDQLLQMKNVLSLIFVVFIALSNGMFGQEHSHSHDLSPQEVACRNNVQSSFDKLKKDKAFKQLFYNQFQSDYVDFLNWNQYEVDILLNYMKSTYCNQSQSVSFTDYYLASIERTKDNYWFNTPVMHPIDGMIQVGKYIYLENEPASNKLDKDNPNNPKAACDNADFEYQDYTNWTRYCGDVTGAFLGATTNETTSCGTQHALMTGGTDAYTSAPRVFEGSRSAMLGDGTGTGAKYARLRRTFTVSSADFSLTYNYMAVLQDPGTGHADRERPFFNVKLFDAGGNEVNCATYFSYFGDGAPGWVTGGGVAYRTWTSVFVPLGMYNGQTLTFEITVGDCSASGHWGYAYVDIICDQMTIDQFCQGTQTILQAPTTGIQAYEWSTGATTSSIAITAPGVYTCNVLPIGSICSALLTYTATVYPVPSPSFTAAPNPTCVGGVVNLASTTTIDPGGSITGYQWNFGDGISSPSSNGTMSGVSQTTGTYTNPNHTYNTAGTGNITLTVTTADGCTASIQNPLTVVPGPTATITGASTHCEGTGSPGITLTGGTTPGPYTFTYNVNGGASQTATTSGGSSSVTIPVPNSPAGTYTYNITQVSDPLSASCVSAVTGSQTITINPTPNATIGSDATVCAGAAAPSILFTGSNGTSTYQFTYSVNGGASQTINSTGSTASVTVPTGTPGTYVYTLSSVTDVATGCSNTITAPNTATVVVNPVPNATAAGATTVCQNGPQPTITFTGTNSTNNYTFTYNLNGGTSQTITTTGGGNTGSINVPTTTPGTYTYTLTNVTDPATGCGQTVNDPQVIVVNPLPTATIAGTTTICEGSTTPQITFTGSGATPDYEFTYSLNGGASQTISTTGGNAVSIATPTAPGTYTYTLQSVTAINAGGCSQAQSGTAIVTINPMPTASIAGATTVCQNDTQPNIIFTGNNSSSNYTFTYSINGGANQTVTTTGGANTATISVPTSSAGTFTYNLVNVSDPNTGCNQNINQTQVVTVNPLPTATISGTTTLCQGAPSASVVFTGLNGTSDYQFTYALNGGSPQTITTSGGNTATITVPTTNAGTYSYVLQSVQDVTTGCSQTQSGTATVIVNPMPSATSSGATVVCQNDSQPTIIFTGNNSSNNYSFTYTLNGGANQVLTTTGGANTSTISVPTTSVGTFTYNLINVADPATGCNQNINETQIVTVNPLPTATISGTTTLCQGASPTQVIFTGANGTSNYQFTYSLNGGSPQTITTSGGNTASITIPTTIAGTYSYVLQSVQDVTTGCSQTQSGTATVIINPMPNASSAGATVVCQNDGQPSIVFTGNNSSNNYSFTFTLNGGAPQTVTTSGGSNQYTINVPTNVAGTFTYNLINVADPATGCNQTVSETQVVTVNPLPSATVYGTASLCQGSTNPQITFSGTNGTSEYLFTYSINGGAPQTITTSGSNTVTVDVPTTVATTYTYQLISVQDVTTGCSQTQTGSAIVTVGMTPVATISNSVAVCQDATAPGVTFTGSNSSGQFAFSYTINGGPIQVATSTNGSSATVTQPTNVPGTYVYHLINVMDPATMCNYDVDLSATITVSPLPNASISSPVSACQMDATLPEIVFTGLNGTDPYTFTYNINGGANQYANSSGGTVTFQIPTSAVGTFTYTITNVQEGSTLGCQQAVNEQTVVTIHALPIVDAGNDQTVCANTQVVLTGAGAQTYVWDNGVTNGVPFTANTTTTYTVIGTDNNGCQNNDYVKINVIPIPVVDFDGQDLYGCSPVTPILTNHSIGNLTDCKWYIGNGQVLQGCSGASLTITDPGCYDVTLVVSTPEGCTSSLTMTDYICVEDIPIASFYPSPAELNSYNWESQMVNTTQGATNYVWNFGDGTGPSTVHSPTHAFPNDEAGTYTVTLIASTPAGCADTAKVPITVVEVPIIYVPNTFTPDGDDYNETFKPILTSGFDPQDYTLYVFNRWGEMVFESHDPSIGWNGKYGKDGKICQDGTYTWKIEVKMKSSSEHKQYVGHVNIIR
ncbi:MAG: PKD domain-containing protein [Crocinitomicaceae bacterium]|nr:PKD domain-containing protein [Crocinitomicaceae bacterium]